MQEKILLVSSSEKTTQTLGGFLKAERGAAVETAASGAEARRHLLQQEWSVVLVNTPLKDEFGDSLARDVMANSATCAVLIVAAEMADEVGSRVEEAGVMVLAKPISKALLFQTMKLAQAAHRQLTGLRRQNDKLQKRLEEMRLVDRAKCALIQYRQLTEPQAHHFIEREAMDNRITRKQVAQEILRTFEGLD